MTKADLIEEVSRVVEMTRKEAEVIVEAIFDSIVRSLRGGDKIEIRGFGSFRTRQRQPRVGRNPKTGARVEVPAKEDPLLQAQQGVEGYREQFRHAGARTGRRYATCARRRPNVLMDHLWSPWRYQYVSKAGPPAGCIFCSQRFGTTRPGELRSLSRGAELRDPQSVSLLHRPPDGRALRASRQLASGSRGDRRGDDAICAADGDPPARRSTILTASIIGMNLGESAGAGVPGHIHLHVLPRWSGDTNFMTTVSETRVLPESLDVTFEKMKKVWVKG